MSLCIRQGSKRKWLIQSVWKNLTGLHKTKSQSQFNTSGVTVNTDLEPKTHHQTTMTCTYGYSHFRHFQNCCNRDGNTIFKYMNYVPIVVATVLEVHFSVLKKGVSQYFCLYSVCSSHWCLVMSFWLKVCIYSHKHHLLFLIKKIPLVGEMSIISGFTIIVGTFGPHNVA